MGRNFYYKVLEEATDTIEELDDRLAYLTDVQLISESKKKKEIEYLFKHALAQQATYESILLDNKKELHLKIARSIEKVFAENLHDFYSTLAQHYEKGGNLIKTEEYLSLAGDEAMKTGAAIEAQTYFIRSLNLYRQNTGNKVNLQKVADLEEKIAYAFYSYGQNREAVEYFDKVFAYYDISFPRPGYRKVTNMLLNLIRMLIIIKFQKNKVRRTATAKEEKLVWILFNKLNAVATFDPKRIVLESTYVFKFMMYANFPQRYQVIYASIGAVFFWTGKAVKLGTMLLKHSEAHLDKNNKISNLEFAWIKVEHQYFVGKLLNDIDIDEHFDTGMQHGQPWPLTILFAFSGMNLIESGNNTQTKYLIKRMADAYEVFDNSFLKAQHFRVKTAYFTKFRKIEEALQESTSAIDYLEKTDHISILLLMYCAKSFLSCLSKDFDEAKSNLTKAEKILERFNIALYVSTCAITRSYIEIEELKEAITNQSAVLKQKREKLLKTTKIAIKASKKVAGNYTEALRLRAKSFYLIKKNKSAFSYFQKSIKYAEWLGGKLELARSYFELGKFLSDPEVKYNVLDGHPGAYYLDKAKSMFEEMDLQWDWVEYRKFQSS
jgi:hypothetical protein